MKCAVCGIAAETFADSTSFYAHASWHLKEQHRERLAANAPKQTAKYAGPSAILWKRMKDRERRRRYYDEHREAEQARYRARYWSDPEHGRQLSRDSVRRWRLRDPDWRIKQLVWQRDNPDKVRAYNRRWIEKNPEKLRAYRREYDRRYYWTHPEYREACLARARARYARLHPADLRSLSWEIDANIRDRDQQIVAWVLQGHSYRDIAQHLGINRATVGKAVHGDEQRAKQRLYEATFRAKHPDKQREAQAKFRACHREERNAWQAAYRASKRAEQREDGEAS